MLFTDSDIATFDSLARIDSEITMVAKATKQFISIDGPASICEQAWQECSQRLSASMQMYTSYLMQPGMSGGHVAAVLNTGVPARTQPRMRLQQVVSSETQYGNAASTIENWVAYTALALLFRDASTRLAQDRYQEKFERYAAQADLFWKHLRNNGLPFIWQPFEAPGAKHGFRSGTWSDDNLAAFTAGSSADPVEIEVAVTYCDTGRGYLSQASNGNAESGPSARAGIVLSPGQVLDVDIQSLIPPNGRPDPVGLSQGAWTPLNATHWNLWVGLKGGTLYLQRELTPIATKAVTLASAPVFAGSTIGDGQFPDLNMVFQNVVGRG